MSWCERALLAPAVARVVTFAVFAVVFAGAALADCMGCTP